MIQFTGEHLLPGRLGHFFVVFALISALISMISFAVASFSKDQTAKNSWEKLAKKSFYLHGLSVFSVFLVIFYICFHHYYEYMYAYKHASKELEYKYLLACIWEGQEGSFLLWSIWHVVIGFIFIQVNKTAERKIWTAPVMSVISMAQFILMLMILGVYFWEVRIGNSPFTLTRDEIPAPIFSRPDYLQFIKDGMGLNVLLRNYWMVIHPPVLFLGFASTIVPFGFAYAGMQTKQWGNWIKPALPWTLIGGSVLGVGIMMGGKWAYESLSFGGYWAWDPVENASLVPWLILIAGLHTMLIYQATKRSLSATYLFSILSFVFVLYSTFLTRTGILGDTSVHAFTEAGKAINIMIGLFVLLFTLPILILFFIQKKNWKDTVKEEELNSREFWMFMGSLVLFLSSMFIILITSIPVYNKIPFIKDWIVNIHGGPLALPEDPEFLYNKVMVMVAIIIGTLTAFSQYFKYQGTERSYYLPKLMPSLVLSAVITIVLAFVYPFSYYKHGSGFLGAIYFATFAMLYAVVANAAYIYTVLKFKFKFAGASIAHFGFGMMILGMLISSANKKVISNSDANGIRIASGMDPMDKKNENQNENLTLLRDIPVQMGDYQVTYLKDSSSLKETGRIFYNIRFQRKKKEEIVEDFIIQPDLYMMKSNNISPNPDSRMYLTQDIFTYITNAIDKSKIKDTTQFEVNEMGLKERSLYSFGYVTIDSVIINPKDSRVSYETEADNALMAKLTITLPDSSHVKASAIIQVKNGALLRINDTLYAQNMMVQFEGVDNESRKVKIGIKRSDLPMDYITVKTYIFPYINLVWVGLVIMAIGLILSAMNRWKISMPMAMVVLLICSILLTYMFLFAS